MKTLETYIFARAFKAFLLCLGALTCLVWLSQALGEVDLMTDKGQSFLLFLQITWLILPKFIAFIAPVAVLLAAVYTLNSLNSDSELVIMSSAGISPWRTLKPLILLALGVMVVDASIAHYFSPKTQRQLRSFITTVNASVLTSVIRTGEFRNLADDVTFYVSERDQNGIFTDVFVADDRQESQSLNYMAKQGVITRTDQGTFLVLSNGTIHRRARDRSSISVIDYSSYAFDLSSFERRIDGLPRYQKPGEHYTPYLFNPDPNNPVYEREPGRFRAALHERFAAPLYSLVYVFLTFAMLGRPQSIRGGRAITIASVFIIALILRIIGVGMSSLSRATEIGTLLQYAVPLTAIAACAISIRYRRTLSTSSFGIKTRKVQAT